MDTKTLLRQIGGQAAIARECEISESAVSQWVSDDEIPAARKQYLQLAHPGAHWVEYEKYLENKPQHEEALEDAAQPVLIVSGDRRHESHLPDADLERRAAPKEGTTHD